MITVKPELLKEFQDKKAQIMKIVQRKSFKIVAGFLLAYFALTAIGSTGTVTDKDGKPIEGAIITIVWRGNNGFIVQPNSHCYHVETTTSDRNGRFRVPTFSGSLNPLKKDRQRSEDVFVPGHQVIKTSNFDDLEYQFEPLTGTKSEQFVKVARRQYGKGCGNNRRALPMMKAVYADLVKFATTAEELDRVENLLFSIESIEFGDVYAYEQDRLRGLKIIEKKNAERAAKQANEPNATSSSFIPHNR